MYKIVNSIPADNSFSWRRLKAVGAFYYPRLKIQMIVYPLVAVLFAVYIMAISHQEEAKLFAAPVAMAIGAMANFGPVALACRCRKGLEAETLLPATGTEKCTFILLYGLVAIPLLILVPMLAVFTVWPSDLTLSGFIDLILKADTMLIKKTYGLSIIMTLFPAAVCLCAVVTCKRNRVLMGFVWPIGANMVLGFISGIYGAVMAIKIGTGSGFNGITPQNGEAITAIVLEGMAPFMTVLSSLCMIILIVALVKSCNSIKNRQL